MNSKIIARDSKGGLEVSALLCCYNASRWLRQAIESVLAQTFDSFELVIVDDGSTDESLDIICGYQKHDSRIVVLSKENSGLTDSLNIGMSRARGQWIARLDADDLCEKNRLEEQVQFFRDNSEVVLLGTGYVEIDDVGRETMRHHYPSNHYQLLRNLERLQRFFPHSSAMFRRDVAQKVGMYSQWYRKTQDWDLWLRLAEQGKIQCLRKCLVRVRKHPAQISNSGAGISQLVYATAASTCHFLRSRSRLEITVPNDEPSWWAFIHWIELRMKEDGIFERRRAWTTARHKYFTASNRLMGALRLGLHVAQLNHAGKLVLEKLHGSSLPERLAREWSKQSCAE